MLAIWEKSDSERTLGLLSDWLSEEDLDARFGYNKWRALMRFALWQNDKWRMIDDASDGHNFAYSASEQIHTTSAAASAALTRYFRATLGKRLRRGAEIRGGSCDMKGAYKQLANADDLFRYIIIEIYHPFLLV